MKKMSFCVNNKQAKRKMFQQTIKLFTTKKSNSIDTLDDDTVKTIISHMENPSVRSFGQASSRYRKLTENQIKYEKVKSFFKTYRYPFDPNNIDLLNEIKKTYLSTYFDDATHQISVNQRDGEGRTLLHTALMVKSATVLEIAPVVYYLVISGTDINAKMDGGITPIALALDKQYFDIAIFLISNGAVVEDKESLDTIQTLQKESSQINELLSAIKRHLPALLQNDD